MADRLPIYLAERRIQGLLPEVFYTTEESGRLVGHLCGESQLSTNPLRRTIIYKDDIFPVVDLLGYAVRGERGLSWKEHPRCKYCDQNGATKTLIWLKDKQGRPARICVPWCGCDLQEALRRFWPNPYTVVEGVDYQIEELRL